MSRLLASLLLVFGSMSAAFAKSDTVYGGRFFIVDQTAPIQLIFNSSEADYVSSLWVTSKDANGKIVEGWKEIFVVDPRFSSRQTSPGTTFMLDMKGSEVFFRLAVASSGYVYESGGPSSHDGFNHTKVTYSDNDTWATVGFEDWYGGGDRDYNDLVFTVKNISASPVARQEAPKPPVTPPVVPPKPPIILPQPPIIPPQPPIIPSVPEPETYAMLLAGLGLVGAVVRRRSKLC